MFASGAGAASRQSIGTTVFGGMLAATLLTLIFVPVFYAIVERARERGADTSKSPSTAFHVEPGRSPAPNAAE